MQCDLDYCELLLGSAITVAFIRDNEAKLSPHVPIQVSVLVLNCELNEEYAKQVAASFNTIILLINHTQTKAILQLFSPLIIIDKTSSPLIVLNCEKYIMQSNKPRFLREVYAIKPAKIISTSSLYFDVSLSPIQNIAILFELDTNLMVHIVHEKYVLATILHQGPRRIFTQIYHESDIVQEKILKPLAIQGIN